jgi:general secretion pathway protein K
MKFCQRTSRQGMVLILALWALSLLTVLAVQMAVQVRQKIQVLSRLEDRSRLQSLAASGVQKAQAVLQAALRLNGTFNSSAVKEFVFNNPLAFENVVLGENSFEVSYSYCPATVTEPEKRFGISDEEGRINVNTANRVVLMRLIRITTGLPEEAAGDLANAIIDWRQYGENEIAGFYSDDYYDNLEFPYQQKKKPFEHFEELLLVKGMSPAIYERLLDFITIYGDGHVNVNTASPVVFQALGLSEAFVEKILFVRRGPDNIEMTADDYFFTDVSHMMQDIATFTKVDQTEFEEFAFFYSQAVLGTQSSYFRIQSTGQLRASLEKKVIRCVFYPHDGKIIYWRER